MRKYFLNFLLIILLMVAQVQTVTGVEVSEGVRTGIDKSIEYFISIQNDDGGFPTKEGRESNIAVTCWVIVALEAAGEDVKSSSWTRSGNNPIDYIMNSENVLNDSAEYAKILLALSAADSGEIYHGENLKDRIKLFQQDGGNFAQEDEETMINVHMWTILALHSAHVTLPNKEAAKEWLIKAQNSDGGYSWIINGESDADDTAIAIQTLVLLGENLDNSITIQRALEFIKSKQQADGGFSSSDMMGSDSNAATDAWVIQGLIAANENPYSQKWTVKGNNPVEHLESLQAKDGSFYWKEGVSSSKVQMTAYALIALSGKPFPININYGEYINFLEKQFTDLPENHWSYESVMKLVNKGIINGYSDGSFKPENKVTRAEFTSMIVKALGYENETISTTFKFNDISDKNWYYSFVKIAYGKGIINGRTQTVFDPNGFITWAEMATMLVNSLDKEYKKNIVEGKNWYSGYITLANDLNLLVDDFEPLKYTTRAECAYCINQLLRLKE